VHHTNPRNTDGCLCITCWIPCAMCGLWYITRHCGLLSPWRHRMPFVLWGPWSISNILFTTVIPGTWVAACVTHVVTPLQYVDYGCITRHCALLSPWCQSIPFGFWPAQCISEILFTTAISGTWMAACVSLIVSPLQYENYSCIARHCALLSPWCHSMAFGFWPPCSICNILLTTQIPGTPMDACVLLVAFPVLCVDYGCISRHLALLF
jgi:hypothetical protein